MGNGGTDYDVVVVGSGFGGSVAALRLTEKGYRVAVIEAGRRFADDDFASTPWDLRQYLWAPAIGWFGTQRILLRRDVLVLSGAGVGGGSLNYATILDRPLRPFYADRQWAHIADWERELAPYYDQAGAMLGVAKTGHPTPIGVFFGEPGRRAPDPFFGGAGPERTGCAECGLCLIGCRVGAKNTLVKNYLYLAERIGAKIIPLTTVTGLAPRTEGGGFDVAIQRTGRRSVKFRHTISAARVVLAAGTWGTQNLLRRMRNSGALPALSPRLGKETKTNSSSIPVEQLSNRLTAKHIGAIAAGKWLEWAKISLTAHYVGGCAIGLDAKHGVIDPYHRVHNYPDMSIVDGSAISADLGVSPALTITAQAERAFAYWPNRGEPDLRPRPGTGYHPVTPVAPISPAVPSSAPAALRLPIAI